MAKGAETLNYLDSVGLRLIFALTFSRQFAEIQLLGSTCKLVVLLSCTSAKSSLILLKLMGLHPDLAAAIINTNESHYQFAWKNVSLV